MPYVYIMIKEGMHVNKVYKIMSKNKDFFPPQILFFMLKNKGNG